MIIKENVRGVEKRFWYNMKKKAKGTTLTKLFKSEIVEIGTLDVIKFEQQPKDKNKLN